MQVIISHVNTDFDALASMIAAKKLYPNAKIVITDKQNVAVKQFLNIYRDTLQLFDQRQIDWKKVNELIIVDVASLNRIGEEAKKLARNKIKVTVYDHHPQGQDDVVADHAIIESVGAAVTLLIEEIIAKEIPITPFEATIFGLGIYTDTGSFNFSNTTARDFNAARFLMEKGMNLEIIQRFADEMLSDGQQKLFDHLFMNVEEFNIDGLTIALTHHQQKKFESGLSTLTRKILEMREVDAVLSIVDMQKRVYIVGRASSERINLLPILKRFKGGGHTQAGSATIKNGDLQEIYQLVEDDLTLVIKPAITAKEIMATPVKSLKPTITIEEAGKLMYRYGHSGFPIAENDHLLGIISRRDLDKATHHGLGHAPVKAYMTTNLVTVTPDTSVEEMQKIMIEHNVGRLPVIDKDKLVGILTRSNIIEVLHNQNVASKTIETEVYEHNLTKNMQEQLPENIYTILTDISKTASTFQTNVYLIGGIVRDIMLERANDDVDIVVEGNGIDFANQLKNDYGGTVIEHESFGTATWEHPSSLKIDVTSSRLEYYDRPAALPNVEQSTLLEDLQRRDFTINAMAVSLAEEQFGNLIDPYHGARDLKNKRIRVLHNLSFTEDPTRIFRAIRFESRFEFSIDKETEQFALQAIDLVKNLSYQRIVYEMEKMINEISPAKIIKRLFDLGFWQLYGIDKSFAKKSDIFIKQFTKLIRKNKDFSYHHHWFTYFLIPFTCANKLAAAKPFALTKKEMKQLEEITHLKTLIAWKNVSNIGDLHKLVHEYSDSALLFATITEEENLQQIVVDYLTLRQQLPQFIKGADLIRLGFKPGPEFKQILFDLDIAILNGKVKNEQEATLFVENYR